VKFLCPGCERLTAFSAFRVEGTSLVLRCSRCGVESRSPASESSGGHEISSSLAMGLKASSAVGLKVVPREPDERIVAELSLDSEEAWSVPAGFCPKCVAVRPPSAATCAQCGLVFANFRPEELQPSAGMAELWQGLVARWDDLGEHDRVLQAATIQGELATVGRLYRIRLARSTDDPIALRGRDEVLRLATASSAALAQTSGEARSPLSSQWKYVLLALLIACCALVFLLLYKQIRSAS
jgi:hypothetical protein